MNTIVYQINDKTSRSFPHEDVKKNYYENVQSTRIPWMNIITVLVIALIAACRIECSVEEFLSTAAGGDVEAVREILEQRARFRAQDNLKRAMATKFELRNISMEILNMISYTILFLFVRFVLNHFQP